MARSKRSQDKKLREREDLVRRSPTLSDGAKILWIELLRGWAWDDTSCCPSQEALGIALGWSVRRVKRRLAELVGFDLLKVSKDDRHARNTYTLCDRIPEDVCHPKRLINKTLRECSILEQGTESSRAILEQGTELSCAILGQGTESSPASGVAGDGIVPYLGTELSPKDESTKDELKEEDESTVRRAERTDVEASKPSNECPVGMKNEGVGLSESRNEIEGLLIETEAEKPIRRKRRGRRAGDASLVGLPHLEPKGATSPAAHLSYAEAGPPPPQTPSDVLELLKWEIEQKYGRDAAESVRTLSAQEAGQIKRAILSKYSPKVVVGMIRVLVWDWEVARGACWPQTMALYPAIEHLVKYRTVLSGAQTRGFDYTGTRRGTHNTYHSRYLSKTAATPECDDPF